MTKILYTRIRRLARVFFNFRNFPVFSGGKSGFSALFAFKPKPKCGVPKSTLFGTGDGLGNGDGGGE